MPLKVIVASNDDIASRQAAAMVINQIKKKPNTHFLLPTGSTPLRLYELLAEKVGAGKTSFAHAQAFNIDEYLGIGDDHPQSYHSFMTENLFSKIDIKKGNTHIPMSSPWNVQKYCSSYEQKIARDGIDLAILGIGENGHVGFNEPGTSFDSTTHVAELLPATRRANARFFQSVRDVPKQAITVGLQTIMGAKRIVVLAFGKKKAQAVYRALEKGVSERCPASILQQHHHVTYILDTAAARKLRRAIVYPPSLEGIQLYSECNLPQNKTIVFFSPHPDDAAICAGALLSVLAKNNKVYEVVVTTGHRAVVDGNTNLKQRIRLREAEVRKESKNLGTKLVLLQSHFYDNGDELHESDLRKARALIQKLGPDIAFVPHKHDPHPTHTMTRKIALASLPHSISLWSFETPWGLFAHRKFNAAFEFSEGTMRKKLAAIRKHVSQIERTNFDDAALSIAHFRRITIAEQLFSELGKKPLRCLPYLELYHVARW